MARRLKSKQLRAAALVARGRTDSEIAQHLKLRRNTLPRWRRLPEFGWEVERLQQEVRAATKKQLDLLFDSSIAAIKTELGRNETDPKRVITALSVLKWLGIDQIMPENGPIMIDNAQVVSENSETCRDTVQKD